MDTKPTVKVLQNAYFVNMYACSKALDQMGRSDLVREMQDRARAFDGKDFEKFMEVLSDYCKLKYD